MKGKWLNEDQIIDVLTESEAWATTTEPRRRHGVAE